MPLPEDVVADDPRYASEHPSHHNQIHAAINDLEALAGTLSDVETTTGSQGKVDTHALDTTSVHGVSDTAQLPAKNVANTFTQQQRGTTVVVKEQPADIRHPDFGGVDPTGVADCTAAIQAAIDYIKGNNIAGNQRGGEVLIPRDGNYLCSGTLDLQDTHGVHLKGENSPTGLGRTASAANLKFTGTGSGRFIDGRSTQGLKITDLSIYYTSNSFTGTLIDLQHAVSGNDSRNFVLENCELRGSGSGITSCAYLLSLHQAIICTIRNSQFSYAQIGIVGRTGAGYSNAVQIEHCLFDRLSVAGIKNANEMWLIQGNTFEPLASNAGGGYTEDLPAYGPVTFIGNWFGDASADGSPWIKYSGNMLNVIGNFLSTAGTSTPAIQVGGSTAMEGGLIMGNGLQATINVGTTGAANIFGYTFLGNQLLSGTTLYTDAGAKFSNLQLLGGSGANQFFRTVNKIGFNTEAPKFNVEFSCGEVGLGGANGVLNLNEATTRATMPSGLGINNGDKIALRADHTGFGAQGDSLVVFMSSGANGKVSFVQAAASGAASAGTEIALVNKDGDVRATRTLRPGSGATGSRPAAATVGAGAEWFDTTLVRPIWSNGTVWVDATGTAV